VLAGDVSALYLAMDWQHILMQLLMGDLDRTARLADHLQWMCLLLMGDSKQCLMLSIGACVFALRQLGCSAAVICWVQDHAQVTSVACTLSCMLFCKLRNGLPWSFQCCCLLLPSPLLGPLACYLYPKEKSPMPVVFAAADTSAHMGLTLLAMAGQHWLKRLEALAYAFLHEAAYESDHQSAKHWLTGGILNQK